MRRWTEYAHGVIIDEDETNLSKECFFTFFLYGQFEFTCRTHADITFVVLYRAGILKELENKEFDTFYGEICWEIFKQVSDFVEIYHDSPRKLIHCERSRSLTSHLYKSAGKVDVCFDIKDVHQSDSEKERIQRNFGF